MSRRLALVALPLVLFVAPLAACTESASIPPAEPPSQTQPLFSSDEEALEAATAAYEEYLAALDSVLQNPRPITTEFDGIAEDGALESAVTSVQEFVDEQVRTTGPRRLGSSELQQVIEGDRVTEVVAYFCEDVRGVLLITANGETLTAQDRPDFSSFEASIAFRGDDSLVVDRQFWSNEASC